MFFFLLLVVFIGSHFFRKFPSFCWAGWMSFFFWKFSSFSFFAWIGCLFCFKGNFLLLVYRVLQKRMAKILGANQPREQAGFKTGFATTDHLHTINQDIEKNNGSSLPLCIAYIGYEKTFDSVGHEALRNIGINESYINIIEDICRSKS